MDPYYRPPGMTSSSSSSCWCLKHQLVSLLVFLLMTMLTECNSSCSDVRHLMVAVCPESATNNISKSGCLLASYSSCWCLCWLNAIHPAVTSVIWWLPWATNNILKSSCFKFMCAAYWVWMAKSMYNSCGVDRVAGTGCMSWRLKPGRAGRTPVKGLRWSKHKDYSKLIKCRGRRSWRELGGCVMGNEW